MVHLIVPVIMVTMVMGHSALISTNAPMTNTSALLPNPVLTLLVATSAPVVKDILVSVVTVSMIMNVITVHVMPMPSAPTLTVVLNVNVMLVSMELVNHVMISMNVLLESMSATTMLAAQIPMVDMNVLVMLDSMVTDIFALI